MYFIPILVYYYYLFLCLLITKVNFELGELWVL